MRIMVSFLAVNVAPIMPPSCAKDYANYGQIIKDANIKME